MNCTTPDKCRIIRSGGMTTAAYYSPVYNEHGNNLNPDMNTTTYQMLCLTCGKKWGEVWQNGKVMENRI